MSRKCTKCFRGSIKTGSRSHSNIRTIRRQYVNLQRKWIGGVHVLICTSCMKAMKKNSVVAVKVPTSREKKS